MDPLTIILIAAAVSLPVAAYTVRGINVYNQLKSIIVGRYGNKVFNARRDDVLLRSILWAVPAKWYYRKEDTWVQHAEKIKEGAPE